MNTAEVEKETCTTEEGSYKAENEKDSVECEEYNVEEVDCDAEEGNYNTEDDNVECLLDDEMYTIDINPAKNHIIFGGKNNSAEIYDFSEERTLTKIMDFTDSVIYTKFLTSDRFLVVTANGVIALMEYDTDVCVVDIGQDISVANFNTKLVVGTVTGRVFLYDEELEHINTFGGHDSEIMSVDYQEGRVLSMCSRLLVAHDEYGRTLYTLKSGEATAFKYITSDVICFARDGKVQVFKENKKLFEHAIEERVECVEFVEKSLVIGGDFEYILLIDTTGHHATFKLNIEVGVTMIKKIGGYRIAFSTVDDQIGILDIRDISTLKLHSSNIGVIFDFSVATNQESSSLIVAVVGEGGFTMIEV